MALFVWREEKMQLFSGHAMSWFIFDIHHFYSAPRTTETCNVYITHLICEQFIEMHDG